MKQIDTIRKLPLHSALWYYFASQGVVLRAWQFKDAMRMLTNPEFAARWGRGMSKSWLASHLNVFSAIRKRRCCYVVSSRDQLKQPDIYWRSNPYVQEIQMEWVHIVDGISIQKKSLTNKNARSGRFDIITIDEQAALEKSQEILLDTVRGTLSTSKYPQIWRYSTPVIGSAFEADCLKLAPLGRETFRNYINTPDCDWVNKAKLDEIKEEYIKKGMYWFYKVEYMALWTTAGGKVFKNLVIEKTLPHYQITSTGTDFHGEFGAVVVGVYWNPNQPFDLWITHEHRYEQKGKFDYTFYHKNYRGLQNNVEGGGFNDGYARFAEQEYGCYIKENSASARSYRLTNALGFNIHICPTITPLIYEDIRTAVWQLSGKLYVKDDAHPCHYLDALMLAIREMKSGGIWGYGKRAKTYDIVKQDIARRARIRS